MAFYSGKLMMPIRASPLNIYSKVITHTTKLSAQEHKVIVNPDHMNSKAQSTDPQQHTLPGTRCLIFGAEKFSHMVTRQVTDGSKVILYPPIVALSTGPHRSTANI